MRKKINLALAVTLFISTAVAYTPSVLRTWAGHTIDAVVGIFEQTQMKELSDTPTTPDAGYKKQYCKDDGKCYTLDSDGEERLMGSGSGNGESKIYGTVKADNDNTDTFSNSLVDCTFELNETDPISGEKEYKITMGASASGELWSPIINVQERSRESWNKFSMITKYDGDSGDLTFSVYSSTDGTSFLTSEGSVSIPSSSAILKRIYSELDSTVVAVRYRIGIINANSGKILQFNDFEAKDNAVYDAGGDAIAGEIKAVSYFGGDIPAPDGWAVCDGTVIDDPLSDFDGMRSYNLNGADVVLTLTWTADSGGAYAAVSDDDIMALNIGDTVSGTGITNVNGTLPQIINIEEVLNYDLYTVTISDTAATGSIESTFTNEGVYLGGGSAAGSLGDQIQGHYHTWNTYVAGSDSGGGAVTSGGYSSTQSLTSYFGSSSHAVASLSPYGTARVGERTRPHTRKVKYMMKTR